MKTASIPAFFDSLYRRRFFRMLHDIFHILRFTWIIILLLFLGDFALNNVEQATDAFTALVNWEKPQHAVFLYLFTIAWSLVCWYGPRLLLYKATITNYNFGFSNFLQKWLPYALAAAPFLITFTAFKTPYCGFSDSNWITMIIGVLCLGFIYRQDKYQIGPQANQLSPAAYRTIVLALSGVLLIVVTFCTYPIGKPVSVAVGPIGVTVLGLLVITVLGIMVLYFDYVTAIPVSLLIVALVILFGKFNNNHRIRYEDRLTYRAKYNQPNKEIRPHFRQWLTHRLREDSLNTAQVDTTREIPVFIVAAEGGGIRAAYWSAMVLAQLSQDLPGFYEHLYAISGVSGGSLGGTLFTSLQRDALRTDSAHPGKGITQNQKVLAQSQLADTDAILGEDFLSPLNAALLFPDMVQRFLPVSVPAFDRARWLEDSWSDQYTRITRNPTFDRPFLSLWENLPKRVSPLKPEWQPGEIPVNFLVEDSVSASANLLDSIPVNIPALFLNGTKAETGQKTIMTNLVLGSPTPNSNFTGVIDLQDTIGRHISVKTAVLLSARFPLFTPPGTVIHQCPDCTDWFNVVDGGYVDNTGLETAQAIANSIHREMESARSGGDTVSLNPWMKQVKVYIIFLKNSSSTVDERPALSGFLDTKAPLNAFYNAWDNSGITTLNNVKSYFAESKYGGEVITFQLDRTQGVLPLGWYLSQQAREAIKRQVQTMPETRLNGNARLRLAQVLEPIHPDAFEKRRNASPAPSGHVRVKAVNLKKTH